MGMNNAIAGATSLSSVTDILSFRAAQKIAPDEETMKGINPELVKDGYVKTMINLERGFSPALLKEQMSLIRTAEGSQNYEGQIERIRQMYGFGLYPVR
jgi:hypothetical protein